MLVRIMLHLDPVNQRSITHNIDNANDLDICMPIYNLLEYRKLFYDIEKFLELL